MPKLSILIPSRNEKYLTKTVEDCFAKAKGETEVVVTLEGSMPDGWKEVVARFPNLHTIHHSEPKGMRPAINAAVASAISRGAKYLMKLDAHCMLDEGFDVKLLADIEPNWIVVPRRKRLDAENWTLQDVGKPDIDYHYLSFPDDPNDFGGPGLNGKVWTERILARKDDPQYEIDDEMSSQGSAWLTSASHFEQLELMDTATFGPFWCEAQEVLMKAWLSGGRCVVNKKTWYAHLHKGRSYAGEDGKRGRGYHLPEKWLSQGRNAAMKWLHNDIWPKQTLPFKTLIERFWPVPSWPENWEELVYGHDGNKAFVAGGIEQETRSVVEGVVEEMGLRIISATYGVSDSESIDVRQRVQSLIKSDTLDIGISNAVLVPGDNP
jgi:glycosyltransferase involved in cell wall biosynthesis